MKIAVQFYSQLKELAGGAEVEVEVPEGATVAELLARLYALHPGLEKWDRNILVGVGVEFVERDHVVQTNESIAIMPPVQGG